MQARPPRILLASNELLGLGHLRIVLKIAARIQAQLTDPSMLLLTGSMMMHAFPPPKGLEVIRIPGLSWDSDIGHYRPTRLPLAFDQVKKLRERIIRDAAQAYRPDLFLVDFKPGGTAGELLPTLKALKRKQETALVLLLRDIVDTPALVRARWRADRAVQALEYYDEIWVYGCRNLYDPIREYQFPDAVARKVHFCGYLDVEAPVTTRDDVRRAFAVTDERFVLVTTGGGAYGFSVLDAYARALAHLPGERKFFSLIVGGPSLPEEQQEIVRRQCEAIGTQHPGQRVQFVDFLPRIPDCMAAADLVVSMGGYNTMTEILRHGRRVVVVPFARTPAPSGQEQVIRALLMERLGLMRVIHPDDLSSERLAKTMLVALDDEPLTQERLRRLGFDFGGLQRISEHVARLLDRMPLN